MKMQYTLQCAISSVCNICTYIVCAKKTELWSMYNVCVTQCTIYTLWTVECALIFANTYCAKNSSPPRRYLVSPKSHLCHIWLTRSILCLFTYIYMHKYTNTHAYIYMYACVFVYLCLCNCVSTVSFSLLSLHHFNVQCTHVLNQRFLFNKTCFCELHWVCYIMWHNRLGTMRLPLV